MANSQIFTTLTTHCIEFLALALLVILALELIANHLRSLLKTIRLLRLDVRSCLTQKRQPRVPRPSTNVRCHEAKHLETRNRHRP